MKPTLARLERLSLRIAVFRPDSDLGNETAWPVYFGWLADKLSRLSAVFRVRVREL
jgi:hypothetical protein